MSTFDEREKGYETRYAREQEFEFRVQARRAKLMGLWAAEKMGLTGAEAEQYARDLVKADFEEPGVEDILRKLKADFAARGLDISEHRIRRELEEQLAIAREQLRQETA